MIGSTSKILPLHAVSARCRRANRGKPKSLIRCSGTLADKQADLQAFEARGQALWYISLVPRTKVSFDPSIWSKPMFARGFSQPRSESNEIDDPETLCADPFNVVPVDEAIAVAVDPLFQDAGRRWSASNGLVKWENSPTTQPGTLLIFQFPYCDLQHPCIRTNIL